MRPCGAAVGPPWRRRGGDREAVLGGVAKGGGTSARPRAVEEEQRDAWAPARSKGEVGVGRGRPRAAGGRRTAPAAREQRGRQGKEKRDLSAISKIFKDLIVKQG